MSATVRDGVTACICCGLTFPPFENGFCELCQRRGHRSLPTEDTEESS